ncbi:helix-turn-helix transcriptional regulator [Pacificibacter marinus]|uniref:Bifunctional biotin--[acetyl-CoA-carboxylase] synthetase/biotin operon repressor n=1 Tax=Pacificibacter marinus TaxID=658057 RepID=A0A1Y5SMX9_9RHOB|nr:YafY family protein [Pacificibacter marinus]SEK71141.1 HTH domain-containing protein [Pacificibacter marinus]SLN44413.1 bifunctional biotin--[acetyl-CoA-carboxylase] synthetase/biotin operon repressor [Pacificibacter marinus]
MVGGRKQTGIRRSDRLFDLIQIMRDGKLHTARDLSQKLEVSERTIWRDMATLRASGVPVEGERGVGYMVTAPITLPPMNLTMGELEALHLAVAILGEATDPELSKSAQTLAAKIDAVLPENSGPPSTGWGFAVYPFADAAAGFKHMPLLRDAVREKKLIRMSYLSLDETQTTRLVRPLQLEYWGRVWTMAAWCELRAGFRVFRVDRIETLIDTGASFQDEVGKTLRDYLEQIDPKDTPASQA